MIPVYIKTWIAAGRIAESDIVVDYISSRRSRMQSSRVMPSGCSHSNGTALEIGNQCSARSVAAAEIEFPSLGIGKSVIIVGAGPISGSICQPDADMQHILSAEILTVQKSRRRITVRIPCAGRFSGGKYRWGINVLVKNLEAC